MQPELPPEDVPQVPAVAHHAEATKRLLDRLGIATPKRTVCNTPDAVVTAVAATGTAVVTLLDTEVMSQADTRRRVGDVRGLPGALAALDEIARTAGPRRYLVEGEAAPGIDLVVRVDHTRSGDVVTLARSGAPPRRHRGDPSRAQSYALCAEILAGLEPVDLEAASDAVFTLATLVKHNRRAIAAIELCPLRVFARGVCALDARLSPQPHSGGHDGCC